MAILITVFSFFTIHILILVTSTEADPIIEVHPSEISPGVSSSLDINCSFSSMDHPEMAAFASLILSRGNASGQNLQDLAAITQFSPDSVTLLTEEKFLATGVHSQTGESFIEVTWEFPTSTQEGVYRCGAHGLDTIGQPIEIVNISTVTVDEANLNDVFEKLKQMETKMSDMEMHIQALEYNNSYISSHTIAEMEQNIKDLQYNNSKMSSYIANLEQTVARLQRSLPMTYIGTFENHDYYISTRGFGEINNAMNVCKSSDGYLVEIDNEGEFNALKEFLNLTSGFTIAMIAGTDEATDGTWVFQSNNKPIPFTSWVHGGASAGIFDNCLGLVRRYSWNMEDWRCSYDTPDNNMRFTCEIPRV